MVCFAVVIPNLNQSHFLPDALESLKHQAVSFNLAVMDGGSVDEFSTVVNKYSDIITCLHSGPDGGQAAAIRTGTDAIEGDVVCWLNADDYYFPGALNKVAAFFNEHPDIDVVYGDAVHVKPDGAFISYFPAIEPFNADKLCRSCFICQPSCFVRRSAYNAAGGMDSALKYTMDWDLWCRLSRSGARFHYLHEPLSAVRCYPQTKTLSGDRRRYQEIWRIGKKYGNRLIPVPWVGFYLYDLSFKKETSTVLEKIMFFILSCLRQLKKKLIQGEAGLLYGFHRWDPRVEGECRINIPWYDKENIKEIFVKVTPENGWFRVGVNSMEPIRVRAQNGYINVKLPPAPGPNCSFHIQCLERREWKLMDFSFNER